LSVDPDEGGTWREPVSRVTYVCPGLRGRKSAMDLMNLAKRAKPLAGKLESVSFLVVDDERLMQVMVRQMLRDGGAANLRFADSGIEAYRMLKAQPVDVVITDWHMPRMTGIELLQAIKNDAEIFKTLVLILSSETSPLWLLHAFEEGVDGFLLKPFTQNALMEAILKLIQKGMGSGKRKLDELIRLKLLGHYQEAIELGEQLLDELESAELSYTLAECHFEAGQYDEALKKAQAAMDKSQDSKSMSLVGRIHMEQGNYEQAVAVLQQAVDKNALNVSRKIELVTALVRSGKAEEAKELLGGIDLDKLTDMNFVELGACHLLCGEVGQAVICLKRAREPLPHAAKVFNACGGALWKMGVREEAIKMYRRCVKISPEYAKAHYNLGLSYCFMESYDEAREALECAVRLKPDYKPAKELLNYLHQRKVKANVQ
jgi:two-component system chemotaxis response regulator CheY